MKKIKLAFQLAIFLTFADSEVYSQNMALNFDGSNDFVEVSGIPNPVGSFTVEAWARMETKGWRTVFSKIANGYFGYTISYDFNNDKMGAGIGTGSSWEGVQSQTGWNLDQWYHVALVYNADDSTMYYYQDGDLQGSTGVVPFYSTTTFKIGNDEWLEVWDGDIDEVRLWQVARTQAEIQSTMNMELTGTEPGLSNYYNFNQGIPGGDNTGITSLIDLQGAADGTFQNFALLGDISNFFGSLFVGESPVEDEMPDIYPNPVSDQLFIEDKLNGDNINYEILNAHGQVICAGKLSRGMAINTGNLIAGFYILRLHSGQNEKSVKFMKA